MVFQSNGFLRPGELLINVDELFNTFVISDQFNESRMRIRFFQEFMNLLKEINTLDLVEGIAYLVIDGSFCSTKKEPRDIDIFLYYDAASEKQNDLEYFLDLNRVRIKRNGIHIVSFTDFSKLSDNEIDLNKRRLDELTRRQFERYYKFSRENIEKGYLTVSKEKLLLGGEQYVSTVTQSTQRSS